MVATLPVFTLTFPSTARSPHFDDILDLAARVRATWRFRSISRRAADGLMRCRMSASLGADTK
jgi:hypothetical protein